MDIIVQNNVPKVSRWAPKGDILHLHHAFFPDKEPSVGKRYCVTRGERGIGFSFKALAKTTLQDLCRLLTKKIIKITFFKSSYFRNKICGSFLRFHQGNT